MGIVLDSSVLISLERSGVHPRYVAESSDENLSISAISVSELQYGLYRAVTVTQRELREEFIASVLETFPVAPFDVSAALIHAKIWADLATAGQQIGVRDAMIAATALARGHAVMTDNVREFSRVVGLEVRLPNV